MPGAKPKPAAAATTPATEDSATGLAFERRTPDVTSGGAGRGLVTGRFAFGGHQDSSNEAAASLRQMFNEAGARSAPQSELARIDRASSSRDAASLAGIRGDQATALAALESRARGGGPSVSAIGGRRSLEQALQQSLAGRAAGHTNLAQTLTPATGAALEAGATGRAQEQAQARNAFGRGVTALQSGDLATRQQEIAQASAQAQMEQETRIANAAAKMQQMGLNDDQQRRVLQLINKFESMRRTGVLSEIDSSEALQQLVQQRRDEGSASGRAIAQGMVAGFSTAAGAMGGPLAGAAVGAAGNSLVSDINAKTDIQQPDIDRFLSSLTPSQFQYLDKKRNGGGQHVGIMAQDLERTPEGRAMVTDGPNGKRVDGGKAAMAALASASSLNERLGRLEQGMQSAFDPIRQAAAAAPAPQRQRLRIGQAQIEPRLDIGQAQIERPRLHIGQAQLEPRFQLGRAQIETPMSIDPTPGSRVPAQILQDPNTGFLKSMDPDAPIRTPLPGSRARPTPAKLEASADKSAFVANLAQGELLREAAARLDAQSARADEAEGMMMRRLAHDIDNPTTQADAFWLASADREARQRGR